MIGKVILGVMAARTATTLARASRAEWHEVKGIVLDSAGNETGTLKVKVPMVPDTGMPVSDPLMWLPLWTLVGREAVLEFKLDGQEFKVYGPRSAEYLTNRTVSCRMG